MPRTQADATRFTPTQPHAHSKASTINLANPPPPNETPAQKVVRLREAARRAKLDQESTWDRVVLKGRKVANFSHRAFGGFLMISSIVLAGCVAVSFVSLARENRQKKQRYFTEQEENYQKALALARQAEADGTITPMLKMVLNKERALEAAEAEKAARPDMWTRLKGMAFQGMSMEERRSALPSTPTTAEVADNMAIAKEQVAMTRETAPEIIVRGDEGTEAPSNAAADSRYLEGRGSNFAGGPLDQLGERTAASISASSRRWYGWLTGR